MASSGASWCGTYITVHVTATAPSTPAAVPIALGDGGRCGGQNSSSLVDELGRVEGVVVSVIEGVRPDVERLRMLLQLLQLLDDLLPTSPAAPWT